MVNGYGSSLHFNLFLKFQTIPCISRYKNLVKTNFPG